MTSEVQRGPRLRGARAHERPAGDRRPPRVLMATAVYVPFPGGTAIHTHEVATRLVQLGADVTVVGTSPTPGFEAERREGDLRVICVRSWPPNRDYYVAPRLARVVLDADADVVHLQGYHTAVAPIVMLAALRARIPYIVTLHSGGHSSRLRRKIRPLQAWLLRPLLTRASRIIAVSAFEADVFSRRLRLPLSAFTIIPSGVDLPAGPPEPPDPGPPLILSIGRVESYKGFQRVIEALPALDRAHPGTRLRIAGSGPYEGELRKLAERLGVADRLEIEEVPHHRRDEMAALLRRSWVVAILSEYESQGLALQEAMALGRPLVVSDSGVIDEFRDHDNLRSVGADADADAIAATILELLDAPLASPPALPTWDRCAATLLQTYEETLAERR
jgi:glycosyltransferase involved in cell wall biosynthesis